MQHVEIAVRIDGRRADLAKRLTGRFYTPPLIGDRLAEQAFAVFPEAESVMDPFCGDGRLLLAWLRIASRNDCISRLRRIVAWDYAGAAVAVARERIAAELSRLGLSGQVAVLAEAGDTFSRIFAHAGTIDVVLTNPPWELLKPDTRDGLRGDPIYRQHLRTYSDSLAANFPGAKSARGKAMTGYGVNLARAGAIASAMLVRRRGTLAIVLPSSIFADQASEPFRREFFSRVNVHSLDWYPAETKLFKGVDQPFVTACGVAAGETTALALRRFCNDLSILDQRRVVVEDASTPLALNVAGEHADLVRELRRRHAPMASLETDMRHGLWLGRELDETRLSECLTQPGKGVPFLKGRHVFPFAVSRNDAWDIDPTKRSIPKSVTELRLAWRDVSRPTQKRRMHVAMVPEDHVTGNSLGVAYFRYGASEWIGILMAIMNSMAFELQVRAQLATAHVSQGILRRCAIPERCFEEGFRASRMLKLVEESTRHGMALPGLEVEVAKCYGLTYETFRLLLNAFPKLTSAERTTFLQAWT